MTSRKLPSAAAPFALALLVLGAGPLAAQMPAAAPAQVPASTPADNPFQLKADHVTLSAADIDKEEAWYVQVLGFQEFERGGNGTDFAYRHLRIPGVTRLDMSWRKGSVRYSPVGVLDMQQGWIHVVFKTPIIDAVYQQLAAKNVTMKVMKNKAGVINNIMVSDPEGNDIEIQP